MRATYTRTEGVRHLFAAYELGEDKLFGHVKPRKTRARFLEFCRYLRSLYPPTTRIAIICDIFSPHLSTARDGRVGAWAAANNVEIAYTPTNSSWLNRVEAQFTALRYFALDGTDHASHKEQASMIRRYIIWRNNHAYDERLRQVVTRANKPDAALAPGDGLARESAAADLLAFERLAGSSPRLSPCWLCDLIRACTPPERPFPVLSVPSNPSAITPGSRLLKDTHKNAIQVT